MFGCQILGEFCRHYSWFNFNPKSVQFGIGGPSPQSGVILFYPHGRLVHTISYIYNIYMGVLKMVDHKNHRFNFGSCGGTSF